MALHPPRTLRSLTSAMLLLVLFSLLSTAEDSIPVDETTVANARVWLDGRPILPPYELAVVGDSAVVLNGLTIHSKTSHAPRDTSLRTPRESHIRRALRAMRAAREAGAVDSVATAVGCAIVNSDTTIAGVARPTPGHTSFELLQRAPDGTVHPVTLHTQKRTSAAPDSTTPLDRLLSAYAVLERVIASGSYYMASRGGTFMSPTSGAPQVARDIRDAARADTVIPSEWWASVPDGQRRLSHIFARDIARHCHWVGR